MAEKRRFLDVWIVEGNTVYREVPYEVVVDWVQQGRLLEDDMLRWSGQAEWFRLGGTPIFSAYLPKAEPFRADDEAEALEPVQGEFTWRRREDDDDDEVDMIPLIDVSLVLLIFFMLASTANNAASLFKAPEAVSGDPGTREFWVGVNSDANGDPTNYLFGNEKRTLGESPDWNVFAQKLKEALDSLPNPVTVVVMGDGELKYENEVKLLVELEKYRTKVVKKKIGVVEKRSGP